MFKVLGFSYTEVAKRTRTGKSSLGDFGTVRVNLFLFWVKIQSYFELMVLISFIVLSLMISFIWNISVYILNGNKLNQKQFEFYNNFRQLADFRGDDCKIGKLFAKHMKVLKFLNINFFVRKLSNCKMFF